MAEAKAVVQQAGALHSGMTRPNRITRSGKQMERPIKYGLEDTQSLEPRLQLMKDYKLAGTAAWRLVRKNQMSGN